MNTFYSNPSAAIFSFPNDKLTDYERKRLAKEFADLLGINVLVCDKDCQIILIHPKAEKLEEIK